MQNMAHSSQACYDADVEIRFSRKFCNLGTRRTVLAEIEEWATTSTPGSIMGYWLWGMAGTGKSTIAMSTCKALRAKGILAGTFFCSRQILECRDYRLVIPTLAYQLARFSKTFAAALVDSLCRDPDISAKQPDAQMENLIIKPWKVAADYGNMAVHNPVVVIDALDECENILLVLKQLVSAIQERKLPGLKFLLTSRPEHDIQLLLQPNHSDTISFQKFQEFILHNVEESEIQQDIYSYLEAELKDVSPSEHQISRIQFLSGRLFIYASTVVKFVRAGGSRSNKKRRLKYFLEEGKNLQDLEQLYAGIISNAMGHKLPQEQNRDWNMYRE